MTRVPIPSSNFSLKKKEQLRSSNCLSGRLREDEVEAKHEQVEKCIGNIRLFL